MFKFFLLDLLEAINRLKRSRFVTQELFNYLTITLKKKYVMNETHYLKLIERISDFKK
jgi:hypothetical protein